VRFLKTDTTTNWCMHDTIRCSTVQGQSSAVQDSTVTLPYPAQWGKINPTDTCSYVFVGNIGNGMNLPTVYKLYNNYPNPFNPSTTIKYDIPKSAFVKLVIYDILGKEVATLVNEALQPGTYEITFDGSNLASGIYFYQLAINNEQLAVKKMVLLK